MLVRDFAETWLRRFPRPDPATNANYASMIRPFVHSFGARNFDSITRAAAFEWGQKHPASVRYVRTMIRDACNIGEAEANPFVGLRLGSSTGRMYVDPPTLAQVNELQRVARWELEGAIVFAAYTGLRLGEQLGLMVEDFDGDVVTVERQLSTDGRLKPLKGESRPRRVLVPPEALEAVSGLLSASGRVWCISRRSHRSAWDAARKQTGIDTDWHSLRHFAATRLVERGARERDVAYHLGHSSDRHVRRLYARHVDEKGAIDRLRAVA